MRHQYFKNSMTSTQQKFKFLQQRVKQLPEAPTEYPHKQKISQIEEFMKKIYQKFVEDTISDEYRFKKIQDHCRNLESSLQQYNQNVMNEQRVNKSKIARWDKKVQKTIEKISKQRRDTEKGINSTLDNYLIELSSAKNKSDSCCKFALRDFSQLQEQLEEMETAIDNETMANRQIVQKINKQFSLQIEELNDLIANEKKANIGEEKAIVDRLENMYKKMHERIQQQKKQREEKEEESIEFLEKVIQKVRKQMIKQ